MSALINDRIYAGNEINDQHALVVANDVIDDIACR